MPNWKKVIVSGSDAALSDVTINDWGSVSASLASIEAGASSTTLQEVTNNGNVTTNIISASAFHFPVNQGLYTYLNGNPYNLITLQKNTFRDNILTVRGQNDGVGFQNSGGTFFAQFRDIGSDDFEIKFAGQNANGSLNSLQSTTLSVSGSIIASDRLGIGSTNPLYTAHFKSGSDAQILIETDSPFDAGLGNVAGIKFKVEDTDGDDRIKGGIFFENTEDGLDYGRGQLLLATNRSGSNANVSINDWRLKVAEDGDVHIKQDLITSGSISTPSSVSVGTTLEVGAVGASPTTIFNTSRVPVSQGSSASVISSLNATTYLGATVDYVIRNSSKDVQRTGNIMISAFNTVLAEGITHTETSTPDIGSTTDHIRFSTSITTAGDWTLTVHNDGSSGTWYVYASIRFITAND